MTIQRTKSTLRGKLSEVVEHLYESEYAPIAYMTKEITVCMLITETDKMLFSPDVYAKLDDVEIEITTDGDKMFIEIIK